MTIETEKDVAALKRIGRIVARCLLEMKAALRPGMTTAELDAIGERFLLAHGARSAPKLSYDFPGATCISINDEVAHGLPGSRIICAGDLVNVDVSAELGGYFADTGGSFAVPPVREAQLRVCAATKRALSEATKVARAGAKLSLIGRAIERVARESGLNVIRNLGSHGVGRALHEAPEFIAPFEDPNDRRRLHEGAVITIEPFLTTGRGHAEEGDDGWTLLGSPGSWTAQYEHTLLITRGRPIVLTAA